MLQFHIDDSLCTRCHTCVRDCVRGIIARFGDAVPFIAPEKEEQCCACQHCLAVCPSGAVSIFGLHPGNSRTLSPDSGPSFEQMETLLRGRRSVRHYRQENVPADLLQRLMADLANVPTGVNAMELTFTLIDELETMRRLEQKVLAVLGGALSRLPDRYSQMKEMFAVDPAAVGAMIFRGAPHALLVSAPPEAPCAEQDVPLSLAYFEMLAQCAGLGTVWWGFLKMILEMLPELKSLLDLPPGHVYYAMLFGYPAIRFSRTVQRDGAMALRKVRLEPLAGEGA